eukprot:SAG11_NODE_4422_length_1901_cov_3.248613_2_plen_184_part_00
MPGLLAGVALWHVGRTARGQYTVLATMGATLGVFYLGLALVGGTTFEQQLADFEAAGWFAGATDGGGSGGGGGAADTLPAALSLYFGGRFHWGAVAGCIPIWLAMFLVVFFSSSLDVAAVQMQYENQLNCAPPGLSSLSATRRSVLPHSARASPISSHVESRSQADGGNGRSGALRNQSTTRL